MEKVRVRLARELEEARGEIKAAQKREEDLKAKIESLEQELKHALRTQVEEHEKMLDLVNTYRAYRESVTKMFTEIKKQAQFMDSLIPNV